MLQPITTQYISNSVHLVPASVSDSVSSSSSGTGPDLQLLALCNHLLNTPVFCSSQRPDKLADFRDCGKKLGNYGEAGLWTKQPYAGILGGDVYLHIICIIDYIFYFTERWQMKSEPF